MAHAHSSFINHRKDAFPTASRSAASQRTVIPDFSGPDQHAPDGTPDTPRNQKTGLSCLRIHKLFRVEAGSFFTGCLHEHYCLLLPKIKMYGAKMCK